MIYLYKNLGETPLQALDRLRLEQPKLKDEKLSYIGRLDPLAEGVMMVIVGEENKERDKYLNFEKDYEFEVIFGLSSDTFDLLGLVTDFMADITLDINEIKLAVSALQGVHYQAYPPYSSKTVAGKALHEYARAGKLDEIEIPTKKVEIFDIKLLSVSEISGADLWAEVKRKVNLVKGDFRQDEILKRWQEVLGPTARLNLAVGKIRMHSSSGTYARSVAVKLGEKLGVPALASSIKRIAYK